MKVIYPDQALLLPGGKIYLFKSSASLFKSHPLTLVAMSLSEFSFSDELHCPFSHFFFSSRMLNCVKLV